MDQLGARLERANTCKENCIAVNNIDAEESARFRLVLIVTARCKRDPVYVMLLTH